MGALHITCNVLKVGGNFVAKIFRGNDHGLLVNQLLMIFEDVMIVKPSSSRNSSIGTSNFVYKYGMFHDEPDLDVYSTIY